MYSPTILAHVILSHARQTRSFSAEARATVVRLLPGLSGMVWCLATLALRYYTVEVV